MGRSIGAPTGVDSVIFTVLGLMVEKKMFRWVVYIEWKRGAPNYISWRHYLRIENVILVAPPSGTHAHALLIVMALAPWIESQ